VKKLLQTLTEAFGPSGYEDEVRTLVRQEITSLADDVRVDALGNLIARKRPGKAGRDAAKIMIAAPLDELGMMVSHVDKNGFVRAAPVGSVLRQYLPGSRVRFANGTPGVIGAAVNGSELPGFDKFYIDVGAASPQECPVKLGDVAVFEGPYRELGNCLTGKSLGNRAGLLIAIEALRNLNAAANEVVFVFAAQGELGARGAATSAYGVDPDLAIALGVTPAGDTPGSPSSEIGLGKGPCITIQDSGMIVDPRLVAWLTRAAQKDRLAHQREVLMTGDNGARRIQTVRAGVPSACLSLPVRYLHSTSEMVDLSDMQAAIKLLKAALRTPSGL
jgi:endoglucanase